MKLLLDTHVFLWLDNEPERLSPRLQTLCQDSETELLLSVVSLWEIQIKNTIGKLNLRLPLQQLPVIPAHVFALEHLPLIHKDPFDRLIIAQAMVEGLTLASADMHVIKYPISVIP